MPVVDKHVLPLVEVLVLGAVVLLAVVVVIAVLAVAAVVQMAVQDKVFLFKQHVEINVQLLAMLFVTVDALLIAKDAQIFAAPLVLEDVQILVKLHADRHARLHAVVRVDHAEVIVVEVVVVNAKAHAKDVIQLAIHVRQIVLLAVKVDVRITAEVAVKPLVKQAVAQVAETL